MHSTLTSDPTVYTRAIPVQEIKLVGGTLLAASPPRYASLGEYQSQLTQMGWGEQRYQKFHRGSRSKRTKRDAKPAGGYATPCRAGRQITPHSRHVPTPIGKPASWLRVHESNDAATHWL